MHRATTPVIFAVLYLVASIGTLVPTNVASAQEIGFLEEFVLAEDREKVLKKLVPGTEQYYYFHALHHQNNQELDKVDELIKPWIKRFGNTQRVREMQHRQALLRYSDDPKKTLDYLTRELRVNFNHQRRIPQTQRDLPSKLADIYVDIDRRIKEALRRSNTDRVTDRGLRLIANEKLSRTQRRHLLGRLSHPDFPNLVELIVADLKEKDSRGFGSLNIHKALTIAQLSKLAAKYPKVKSETNYVNVYLTKLKPSDDVNWKADRNEYRSYLDRLRTFASQLNENFNSLKACILFRLLELDQIEGKYNRNLFVEYLKLPRGIGYANPDLVKNVKSRRHIVNLSANYRGQIMLQPVMNDEPLVRDYLHEFLRDASGYSRFTPYVRDTYLKKQFATVKILNGIGDTEKWASMLSPEEYKGLMDRIDIDFVSTNPEFFGVEDSVELELFLKNVDNLIVKVFEINTQNYYRKHQREIDTDVNLDGLVPNHEQTFTFDESPALRKKHQFKLPQIDKRGVYVVDFIAGGKSSRALIRKGRLQIYDEVTVAGQLFTVVDQSGAVVTDASLWIDGARYNPIEKQDGKILVPFSTSPGRTNAIITHDDFSCLQTIQHVGERYEFKSALLLDRENLTRSNQAKVLIRPSLKIAGGNPVPLSLLEKAKLVVTTVNLDGVTTTKTIGGLELSTHKETIAEFVVPLRLNKISLSFTAQITRASDAKTEYVSASKSYQVNSIDQSDSIQDVHLIPSDRGYYLELLGKSGEVRSKQAVRIGLKFVAVTSKSYIDLQTDERGLIELGNLDGVAALEATVTGGSRKTWNLSRQNQSYYNTIHALVGDTIELPAPAGIVVEERGDVSLLETRGGQYVSDQFDRIKIKDSMVTIDGLKPGNYELRLGYSTLLGASKVQKIQLRVTEGPQAGNVLVGKHRHLERRGQSALHLPNLKLTPKQLKVSLKNADPSTRVHVIANRYMPAFDSFEEFAQVRDLEPWLRTPSLRRSVYMEGRKIGDEYEYILRRKYSKLYPGNMLKRPSLLLDPWATQTTSNNNQTAAEGNKFGSVGNDADRDSKRSQSKSAVASGTSDFANLDFLGDGAVLLSNLKPSKNGTVTIDLSKLGNRQHVRVVAVNSLQTVQRTVNLPLRKLKPRDARLAHSLDPDKHFSQSKQIEILKKGDSLSIDDVVSAKFQEYDDLGDVFQLFQALNAGTHLSKFRFILDWPNKTKKEKQTLYSNFACHELNFFIMKKDKDFFREVVVPHIENKRDKTFMDLWLLKRELDQFATPWKFARLNAVEKILLAQRLEERSTDLKRHVNDLYLMSPTRRDQFDRLYDSTIVGLGMESDKFAAYQQSALERSESLEVLPQLGANFATPQKGAELSGGMGFGGGGAGGGGMEPGSASDDVALMDSEEESKRLSEMESVNGLSRGRMIKKLESLGRKSQPMAGAPASGGRAAGKQFRYETRTRTVPVQKMRQEIRTRKLPDGTIESYTVNVPYTENVTQSYAIQVPVSPGFFNSQRSQGLLEAREKSIRLYRRLDPTKEWIENNYYLLSPEQQKSDLVKMNRFWRDYANQNSGLFLSSYFPEAHRTFTEMMFAMAVLDLPFQAPEHEFEYADSSMKFSANGPVIVLHQQVRDAILERGNTTVLVSENFFQKNDRYRNEDGVQYDKFISGDFLAHALYGGQVVITNPTSTPRPIELLIQIPRGAVACSGSQETQTKQLNLAAFSTQTFEYSFYFPTEGNFGHYPAHVSSKEKVLAVADPVTFKVIDRPASVDKTSWEFVSQNGTEDEVIDFLNRENVLRLDLGQIAFRMKKKSFYERAIETLRNRYIFSGPVWGYSLKHNDVQGIREFLSHSNIASRCGRAFNSELLTIDPVERDWYYHKEYWPLVNSRAHQLGPKRKILNPNFFAQYKNLLTVLANRRELSDDDQLVVTYYLLLQDRIELALSHFDLVSRDAIPSQVQYDYCDAYLDMYREKPEDAATKAEKWAEYPVDHWRNRFKNILAQVDEIRGGETAVVDNKNSLETQTKAAAKSESLDFEIESGIGKLKFQNLAKVQVNYYEMDIELLFSRSPFAQDELEGFSMIRPNLTQTLDLKVGENGKGKQQFELPKEMRNKNVFVEVVAGDQTRSQPYFAHSLDVQMIEKFGQVHVTDQESGKPISKTYVKVYARLSNGTVRFHKDGYTDLRGRFDYVSQSNESIDGIERFSILVMSEKNGAVIRQANRPKE